LPDGSAAVCSTRLHQETARARAGGRWRAPGSAPRSRRCAPWARALSGARPDERLLPVVGRALRRSESRAVAEDEPPLDLCDLVAAPAFAPTELTGCKPRGLLQRGGARMASGREVGPTEHDVPETHRHLVAN